MHFGTEQRQQSKNNFLTAKLKVLTLLQVSVFSSLHSLVAESFLFFVFSGVSTAVEWKPNLNIVLLFLFWDCVCRRFILELNL